MKIKLDKGAYMPTRAHEDDAGLDIYAREWKRKLIYVIGRLKKETAEKFAEMAKAKKKYIISKNYNTCEVVFIKDIDEICKEFTGGDNGDQKRK